MTRSSSESHVLQASCRNVLFGQKGRCANAVPQSHDEQLSLLRQAFQIADRKERQQVHLQASPMLLLLLLP